MRSSFRRENSKKRVIAMSDPKRWLESGGNATQLERELLAGEIAAAPSAKLELAIWQRVLGALPPIGGGSLDNGSSSGGEWGTSGAGASGGGGGAGVSGAGASGAAVSSAGAGGASVATAGAGGALVGAAKASGLGVAKAVLLGIFAGTVTVTGA